MFRATASGRFRVHPGSDRRMFSRQLKDPPLSVLLLPNRHGLRPAGGNVPEHRPQDVEDGRRRDLDTPPRPGGRLDEHPRRDYPHPHPTPERQPPSSLTGLQRSRIGRVGERLLATGGRLPPPFGGENRRRPLWGTPDGSNPRCVWSDQHFRVRTSSPLLATGASLRMASL